MHVLAMVATATVLGLFPAALPKWQSWVCFFASNYLGSGHYWTLLTYPFYHNILTDHIFFAIEMLMFFWFGREVERYIGRRAYATLYLLLIVVQPLAMMALKPLAGLTAGSLAGSGMILFGVGVAFATIYPTAQFFGVIAAKWIVWIFLSIFTVYFLAHREWPGLVQFWVIAAASYGFIRNAGVGAGNGLMDWLDNARMEREERKLRARAEAYHRQVKREEASVDSVLEKISRSGLASLDAEEHEVLQRARRKLMQQDRPR
jgi:membrane associated rhomboid family serine protease